ncbi:hypothetical protein IE53DRAFT_386708 [Violaceomyces palustris]|uniref:Uncharacterized protein n=1 Tax=Violaceomyces palustris TaxID=1673888 RepID=A0ACD0NYU1_9BASI|nr:hypothetical protein IE53DRAFT_386708 [Violaceomyces palustris]
MSGSSDRDAPSLAHRISSYLTAIPNPISYCLPSSSRQFESDREEEDALDHERQSLLDDGQVGGGDAYDDSDAISLLSNIADRDSRSARGRRRSARLRARRENRRGARGALLACGLFGRAKGQIQTREETLRDDPIGPRHARSGSESSLDSGNDSLANARFESGDEDAGMLDDQAIADLSLSVDDDAAADSPGDRGAEEEEEEEEGKRRKREAMEKEREEKKRNEREQEEAKARKEAEEEDARLAEEEARLAAEEEAAIAKARRRAARKAAKAGLLKVRQEAEVKVRWRTEAEAEAAAGGFDFAEEGPDEPQQGFLYSHEREEEEEGEGDERYAQGVEDYMQDEALPPFASREEEEAYYHHMQQRYEHGQESTSVEYVQQPGVGGQTEVHHHHYYHAPPSAASFLSPNMLPALPSPGSVEEQQLRASPDQDEVASEDEADIAGLSFGRKKNRRGLPAGSSSQNSGGSGSRNSGSASGHRAGIAAEGTPSSANGNHVKVSYRDRPRRHQRNNSRSTTSSSGGGGGYQAGGARSPVTFTPPLPNLYEPEAGDRAEFESGTSTNPHALESPAAATGSQQEREGATSAGSSGGKRSYKQKRLEKGEAATSANSSSSSVTPRALGQTNSSNQAITISANLGNGIHGGMSSFPSTGLGRTSWSGGGGGGVLNLGKDPKGANWFSGGSDTRGGTSFDEGIDGL